MDDIMLQRQTDINKAFGRMYFAIYSVDLISGKYLEISTLDIFREHIPPTHINQHLFDMVVKHYVSDGYKESMTAFLDMTTLQERLAEQNAVSNEFYGTTQGWCRASLVVEKRGDNGEVQRFIYVTQEINQEVKSEQEKIAELKRAYVAADAANQAKSDFLFRMSHDINTPLNAIMGFNNLLLNQQNLPEIAYDYAEKIKASSNLLLSLLDGILDISNFESEKFSLKQNEIFLDNLISELETVTSSNAKKKSQSFVVDAKNLSHHFFVGDRACLSRVLFDILNNAVRYTPHGGEITFTISDTKIDLDTYEITFSVKDTGIGIPNNQLQNIFEMPYLRPHEVYNRVPKGLSLPMARNSIKMMNGEISVKSKLGVGSEFIIKLPMKIVTNKQGYSMEFISSKRDVIQGKNILVVDDNELNMEIITQLLSMSGAFCDIAINGKNAVEMVEKSEIGYYDLILMDIRMPVMDGCEATKRIRALRREDVKKMIIIAVSANNFSEDIENSFQAGMNAHLPKPLDMKLLRKTIEDLTYNLNKTR